MLVEQASFERQRDALARGSGRNEASFRISIGKGAIEGHVSVSTPGLLAIGGMVSSILLSAAAIVWVSTRKRPRRAVSCGMRRS